MAKRSGTWLRNEWGEMRDCIEFPLFLVGFLTLLSLVVIGLVALDYRMQYWDRYIATVTCHASDDGQALWRHESKGVVYQDEGRTRYVRADTGEQVVTTLPCVIERKARF